jgi:glycine hydroxymethyltransferase
MRRDYERLGELISSHTEWRNLCLNLIAAENVQSPSVKAALASDLGGRYGTFKDTECVHIYTSYAGTRYIAEIANTTSLLARRVFEAEYVDIRPLSGNIADVVKIQGLTAPGETVVNTSAKDWGTHLLHGRPRDLSSPEEEMGTSRLR